MKSTIKVKEKTYHLTCNFGVIKSVWQRFNLPHFNAVLAKIEALFPDLDVKQEDKKDSVKDAQNPLNWSVDDWNFLGFLFAEMVNEGARKENGDTITMDEVQEIFFPFYHKWLTHLGICFFGFLGSMSNVVQEEENETDKKKVNPKQKVN